MKTYRDVVAERILNDDDYVFQVLKVVYDNQTEWEREHETTVEPNGCGFNIVDAKHFTPVAEAGIGRGYLTAEELATCRQPDKHGFPVLAKYWRQVSGAPGEDQFVVRIPRKPLTSEGSAPREETKIA
jgi:hypothetical protein